MAVWLSGQNGPPSTEGQRGGTFKSTALSACSQWQFWVLVVQTPQRAQGKEINEINEYTKATRQGEHLPSVLLGQEETLRKETLP